MTLSRSLPVSSRPAQSWEKLVRAFDAELAQPEIEDIPIGSTLTDLLVIEFINGGGQWGLAQRCMDRLRWLRRYLTASRHSEAAVPVKRGQILLTWRSSTARIDDLLLPVLQALSPDRCAVLYNHANILPQLPSQAVAVNWTQAVSHDRRRWRRAFRRCWPEWRSRLRYLSKSFGLPSGAMERLRLNVIVNSQIAIGSLGFLERCRPIAVVTDYDRARLSSCLVLAARSLGIPTFSLQHGVMDRDAVGYVPVIADRMFCWGELHRRIMTEAGQDPAHLAIGGCPRLTPELVAEPQKVRGRLSIDPSHRVVMLGTSPIPPAQRKVLAECFCRALQELDGITGIVRLHPSESLEFYTDIAGKYPQVKFLDNVQVSLDESLVAADVVVVQNSGLGSDALVKRRLVVVVDVPGSPLGHGKDLVEKAGCPCVKSPQHLAQAIARLFADEEYRREKQAVVERYVQNFCAYYGADSASRIAEMVDATIAGWAPGAPRGNLQESQQQGSSA